MIVLSDPAQRLLYLRQLMAGEVRRARQFEAMALVLGLGEADLERAYVELGRAGCLEITTRPFRPISEEYHWPIEDKRFARVAV